jgi:hypothetical protein
MNRNEEPATTKSKAVRHGCVISIIAPIALFSIVRGALQ